MFIYPPTVNGLQKTLGAALDQGVTASATLNNVTGIQNKKGLMIINRIDTNGAELSASLREYMTFTGTSGSTVTGLVRGLGGTTDQDHAIGSVVEFVFDVTQMQAILDALDGTSTDLVLNTPKLLTGINDTNGNELIKVTATGSAVNEFTVANAVTGSGPTLSATGSDTDIDINLTPKGAGDVNIPTSANIQVNGSDPKRGIYVPAMGMYPSTTAGCAALAQVESSTNDVNIKVLDFDGAGSSKESAEFGIQSPSYWDASTVTAQFIWYATAGSGTVNWECSAVAFSDDDALDAAYGTLQEVTDTLTATGDVHITDETSAITVAGTPVAGDWVNFKISRDPANDTNTSDARLMGVRIRFGVKQYDDQ